MTAKSLVSILCWPAVLLAGVSQAASPDDLLPPLISYNFVPKPTPVFSFTATTPAVVFSGRSLTDCMHLTAASFTSSNSVGNASIVTTSLGSGCFATPAYSNGFYTVQPGIVSLGDGSLSFDSYTISPPAVKATGFVASGQMLYVLPPADGSAIQIYTLNGGNLQQVTPGSFSDADGAYVRSGLAIHKVLAPVTYVLVPAGSSVVPGPTEQLILAKYATQCGGDISASAMVGNFALVTTQSSTGVCYTNGIFNNDAYLVQSGQLVGGGNSFEAYQVNPPQVLASQFLASHSAVYYYSQDSTDSLVSLWDGLFFTQSPVQTAAGNFANTDVTVDGLKSSTVFVVQPKQAGVTIWNPLASGVEGAWLDGSSVHSLTVRHFDVGATPFVPARDFNVGPANFATNFGTMKRFFSVQRADGHEGTVWQDMVNHSVFMTWVSPDMLSYTSTEILTGGDYLEAAGSDGKGQIVLLMLQGGPPPDDKTASIPVYMVLLDSTSGVKLAQQELPTDRGNDDGLDVHAWAVTGASLAWNTQTGLIGVVMARFITLLLGENHQGCVAFVVDASTLKLVRNHGQTTGHCFGNSVVINSAGNFLNTDNGDNFPRGVHVTEFGAKDSSSRTVHRYKAQPGVTASSPAGETFPIYAAVSTAEETFYEWSNDNNVYTEIAHPATIEVDDSYLVFFSGEVPDGLNGAKTGAVLNAPRNAAFVRVPKDLTSDAVLSDGPVDFGGFYDFTGKWTPQTDEGITLLTEFTTLAQNVMHMKTARLAPGKNVITWELWEPATFNQTQFMVVDDTGSVVVPPTTLNFPLRLPADDEPRVVGSRTVFYSGTVDGNPRCAPRTFLA